jgi:hypothetical protein
MADAWSGSLPELLCVDERRVQSMQSQARQILYREVEDAGAASRLREEIESSVGAASDSLLGYSNFQDRAEVALLRTGSEERPRWLAGEVEPSMVEETTAPLRAGVVTRSRILGGAALAWRRRQVCVQVALEQRGDVMSRLGEHGLLGMVERVELCAAVRRGTTLRRLELVKDEAPMGGLVRSAQRLEASFAIESSILKEYKSGSGQVWLLLHLSRELFCLPPGWATCWFQVDMAEPPGMVY